MSDLVDAHWFPLASQGNIYSMTKLCYSSGCNKILVASLKRTIYSCEYDHTPEGPLRPMVKELLFTYIPSGAEIISIDAYSKSECGDGFVIGITIMKASTDTSFERYLNIYTEGIVDSEGDESSSIEAIAQNCLMVELNYTPYHLYHTTLPNEELCNEVVWLISGSDHKIHMIREDKQSHGYSESPIEKHFPELYLIQAIALWINIYYYDEYKWRLSAIGCECGLVAIALVDVTKQEVVKNWALRYDKPISSVCIFPHLNNVRKPTSLTCYDNNNRAKNDKSPNLNLLITNTSNSIVFMDILNQDLKDDVTLCSNELSDCILCSCVADINMDGQNEILLGTYSQEVLIFTLVDNRWELLVKKFFDSPVHSICYMDITNDGMKELIVLTQRGVHILQHNRTEVINKWKSRIQKLLNTSLKEDDKQQLSAD